MSGRVYVGVRYARSSGSRVLETVSYRDDHNLRIVYSIFQTANRRVSLKSSHSDGSTSGKPVNFYSVSSKFELPQKIEMLFAESHEQIHSTQDFQLQNSLRLRQYLGHNVGHWATLPRRETVYKCLDHQRLSLATESLEGL